MTSHGDTFGPGSTRSAPEAAPASSPSVTIPIASKRDEERHIGWCLEYLRRYHNSPLERVAVRSALGDAAHLCDAVSRDILAENRRGRSSTVSTKRGEDLALIAKRCGDALWAMRDRIRCPPDAQGMEAGTGETACGLDAKRDSPVAESDAP